jgi:hypothetical protein
MDSRSTSKGYHIYREIRVKKSNKPDWSNLKYNSKLVNQSYKKELENIQFSGSFFIHLKKIKKSHSHQQMGFF